MKTDTNLNQNQCIHQFWYILSTKNVLYLLTTTWMWEKLTFDALTVLPNSLTWEIKQETSGRERSSAQCRRAEVCLVTEEASVRTLMTTPSHVHSRGTEGSESFNGAAANQLASSSLRNDTCFLRFWSFDFQHNMKQCQECWTIVVV